MSDSIFAKVKNFFFEEEIDDLLDDEMDEPAPRYHDVPEKEERVAENRRSKLSGVSNPNNVSQIPMPQMKMVLYKPMKYEDSQVIVDNIRARKPVIFDMTGIEQGTMQRVVDFVAGAAYSLDAAIKKVAPVIFLVVPCNMSLIYSDDDNA